MNKGSRFYRKDARLKVNKALKKKKNFRNFYIYSIPSLIFRTILFFLAPLFVSQDYKMAEMIKFDKDITLPEIFKPLDDKRRVRNSFLMFLELVAIFLGISIVILVPTGLVFLFAQYVFGTISVGVSASTIGLILSIPGAVVYLVFLVAFPLYIAPMLYLDKQVDEDGISDVMKNCYKTMKFDGKWSLFANCFWPMLGIALFAGLFGFGFVLTYSFLPQYLATRFMSYSYLASYIILFAGIAFMIFFVPRKLLQINVANSELFDDLFLREPTEKIEGIVIKSKKVKKIKVHNYADNLVRMFDDTKDMSPLESIEEEKEEAKEETQETKEEE